MCRISSKSAPFASDSGDSPRSALTSIESAFTNWSVALIEPPLALKNLLQPFLLLPQQTDRLRNRYLDESHLFTRPKLSHAVHIGRDPIRDLRVAAGGLLIYKENDGLLILRHLNRAE